MTFVLWCKLVVSSKVTSYAVYRGTYRGTDLRTMVYRGTEIRRGTHPYKAQERQFETETLFKPKLKLYRKIKQTYNHTESLCI